MMNEEDDLLVSVDLDLSAQSLLRASANHDLTAIKELLKTTAATVQDADTGFTPLHAAIAACEQEAVQVNGNHDHGEESEARKKELENAAEAVKLLLQSGAIWNDLDVNNETPGCIARRLGLEEIYGLIVDAGVRAELLLARLDEYQPLAEDDDGSETAEDAEDTDVVDGETTTNNNVPAPSATEDSSASNEAYLQSNLTFGETNILDTATNGVMMSWEKPIMERSAALLLPRPGLRVLNVGHGMGIIDEFIQSHSPSMHHIIEAHPDVLAKMKVDGWMEKPGVQVHEGRWQDVLPKLVTDGDQAGGEVVLDAIYFDTFAEDYKALREFFQEYVIQFLHPEGSFGFFNGMGADRQIVYDVYNKVSKSFARARAKLMSTTRSSRWISLKQDLTLNGKTSRSQICSRRGNGTGLFDLTGR
jgi:protein arginine N-methyltransferase 2